jgi:hypothetical protein
MMRLVQAISGWVTGLLTRIEAAEPSTLFAQRRRLPAILRPAEARMQSWPSGGESVRTSIPLR